MTKKQTPAKYRRQLVPYVAAVALLVICSNLKIMAQDKIVRTPLLTAQPINKMVRRTEVKEIIFKPLQKTSVHLHPCPVVGYIAEGSAVFQIKGGPVQLLKQGEAFYEPANTVIEKFDNASDRLPLKFIAFYLIDDEREIIKILSPES